MNVDTYWSQDTVYFFATCALFPEKLNGITLTAKQMSDYIIDFDDAQAETLLAYQAEGLLKVTLTGEPEHRVGFLITDINQQAFKNKLVSYLEKYREGELLPGFSNYIDLYEDNKALLYAHLAKSKRDCPLVNPRNIWTYSSGRPFWEAILTADLVDGDIRVKEFEQVASNEFGDSSLPFVKVEILNPLNSQSASHATLHPAELKLERISFSKWRVVIELEDGSIFLVKENLTEGHAPYSLLKYLVAHPGELVTLQQAKKIDNCANIHKLGEKLRQCYFDDPLKELVFDECGNTEVRLKASLKLSSDQLKAVGLKQSERVGV